MALSPSPKKECANRWCKNLSQHTLCALHDQHLEPENRHPSDFFYQLFDSNVKSGVKIFEDVTFPAYRYDIGTLGFVDDGFLNLEEEYKNYRLEEVEFSHCTFANQPVFVDEVCQK